MSKEVADFYMLKVSRRKESWKNWIAGKSRRDKEGLYFPTKLTGSTQWCEN